MKQRFINMGKNALLVFLTLLMALLTVLIWVQSLSWEDIPVESKIGQLYLRMAYGSASVFGLRTEDIPAAYPIEIAVNIEGRMYGAQNDTSGVDALYEQFQTHIRTALNGSAVNLRAGEEKAYAEALKQDCIYFKYPHELPIDLIFLWLGESQPNLADISVKSVLISAGDEVWIRDGKNQLYFYNTDIDTRDWTEQLGDSIFQPCCFVQQKYENSVLSPETLLFESRKQFYPLLETSIPNYLDGNGVDSLQIVLEAFEYNTSIGNYMDDTTRVFVNNNSTLRVGADGSILFHATSLEGGMEAYRENEVTEESEMSFRVSAAKAILEQIQKSYTTDADFFLRSIVEEPVTGRVQLQFQFLCNGIPIIDELGMCASVEFLENTLVAAEISARTFTSTDRVQYLIPAEQLIKMASENDTNLLTGYSLNDNILYPHRYFERAV